MKRVSGPQWITCELYTTGLVSDVHFLFENVLCWRRCDTFMMLAQYARLPDSAAVYSIAPSRKADRPLVVTAVHPFTGQQAGDLSFNVGDKISVVTKTDSQYDWWEGQLRGQVGIFPANFVSFNWAGQVSGNISRQLYLVCMSFDLFNVTSPTVTTPTSVAC